MSVHSGMQALRSRGCHATAYVVSHHVQLVRADGRAVRVWRCYGGIELVEVRGTGLAASDRHYTALLTLLSVSHPLPPLPSPDMHTSQCYSLLNPRTHIVSVRSTTNTTIRRHSSASTLVTFAEHRSSL